MKKNRLSNVFKVITTATLISLLTAGTAFAADRDIYNNDGTTFVEYSSYLDQWDKVRQAVLDRESFSYEFDGRVYDLSVIAQKTTDLAEPAFTAALTALSQDASVPSKSVEEFTGEQQGDFVVESISAINAREIKVTFNKAVNEETAINEDNYQFVLNGNVLATSVLEGTSNQKGELTDGGKSVVFRIDDLVAGATPDYLANADRFSVHVSTNVLDTAYNPAEKYVDSVHTFNDNATPKLVSDGVTVDAGNRQIYFSFDEPVDLTNVVVKIDGIKVADVDGGTPETPMTQDNEADPMNYDIVTPALAGATYDSLFAVGTHNVVIYNAQDALNTNPNVASVINASYTITADAEAPAVVSATPVNSRAFHVKFDEAIQAPTAANFVVKKGTHTFASLDVLVAQDLNADSTGQTYRVSVREQADYQSGILTNPASDNPLWAAGDTSVALTVTVKDYKDSANLLGAPTTKTVTLTKDTKAPKLVGTAANTIDNANAQLDVKFDGDIDAGNVDVTKIVVKNKDGVALTNIETADISVTNDIVTIDLDANTASAPAYASTEAPYTVVFKAGAVRYAKDTNAATYDVNNNKNASELVATVNGANPVNAVTVENSSIIATTTVGINGQITINYSQDMDSSAINPANYLIDGVALDSNTTVTFVGNKQDVVLTLPASMFDKTQTAKLTINSVKTKEGSLVVADALTKVPVERIITFTDNTKPVVSKAEFYIPTATSTETNQLLVTFSENMNTGSLTGDDFKLTVNGNEVAISTITAGATNKEAIIGLGANVNISNTNVALQVIAEGANNTTMDTLDAASNKLTEGTKAVSGKVVQPTVVTNQAPVVANAISDILSPVNTNQTVDLTTGPTFIDDDLDTLSYVVASSNTTVATVAESGGTVTVTVLPGQEGTTTIRVTANDGNGGSVYDEFDVAVDTLKPTADATTPVAVTHTPGGTDLVANESVAFKFSEALTNASAVDVIAAIETALGGNTVVDVTTGDNITFTATVKTAQTIDASSDISVDIDATKVIDVAGNAAGTTGNVTFTIPTQS